MCIKILKYAYIYLYFSKIYIHLWNLQKNFHWLEQLGTEPIPSDVHQILLNVKKYHAGECFRISRV